MKFNPTIISATCLLAGGFWFGAHVRSQSLPVVRPFSAEIRKSLYRSLTDDKPEVRRVLYTRRSDRSFVRRIEHETPDHSATDYLTEIYDARTHSYTLLEPFTKSKITFFYTAAQFWSKLNSMESENCDEVQNNAKQVDSSRNIKRFGFSGRYEGDTRPIESGSEKVQSWMEERWVAPELRCFALKEVSSRSDGPRTETDVLSLTEGQPNDDAFSIPTEYTERSPIAFEEVFTAKFPGSALWDDSTTRRLNSQYERSRIPSR